MNQGELGGGQQQVCCDLQSGVKQCEPASIVCGKAVIEREWKAQQSWPSARETEGKDNQEHNQMVAEVVKALWEYSMKLTTPGGWVTDGDAMECWLQVLVDMSCLAIGLRTEPGWPAHWSSQCSAVWFPDMWHELRTSVRDNVSRYSLKSEHRFDKQVSCLLGCGEYWKSQKKMLRDEVPAPRSSAGIEQHPLQSQ